MSAVLCIGCGFTDELCQCFGAGPLACRPPEQPPVAPESVERRCQKCLIRMSGRRFLPEVGYVCEDFPNCQPIKPRRAPSPAASDERQEWAYTPDEPLPACQLCLKPRPECACAPMVAPVPSGDFTSPGASDDAELAAIRERHSLPLHNWWRAEMAHEDRGLLLRMVDELTADLKRSDDNLISVSNCANALIAEGNELRAQLDDLREKDAAKVVKLSEAEGERCRLVTITHELRAQLAEAERQLEFLRTEVAVSDAACRSEANTAKQWRKRADAAEARVIEQQAIIADLRNQLLRRCT